MIELDFTSIVLAIISLLGGCAWIVNYRKDKQEAIGLKKENQKKDMELSKMFVEQVDTYVVGPLRKDVDVLKERVNKLENAIQKIQDCPNWGHCPVWDELHKQSGGDD